MAINSSRQSKPFLLKLSASSVDTGYMIVSESNSTPVFNRKGFLSLLSNNREAAISVLTTYIEQSQQLMSEIQVAADHNDLSMLLYATHKLAGSSSSIGAERFGQKCKSLEMKLQDQSSEKSAGHWISAEVKAEIEREYDRLREEVEQFLATLLS